jgi:hypothetical protein
MKVVMAQSWYSLELNWDCETHTTSVQTVSWQIQIQAPPKSSKSHVYLN